MGITIHGEERGSQHARAKKKAKDGVLSILFYNASSVAADSRTITTTRISKKDVRSFVERLRKAFPFLARYDDKRTIQCWLITVEAINTIRRRSFRGSALYNEIVDSFLGPPPRGHVGLNSTTCLSAGIEDVENEAAGMSPFITSDAKKAARAALQVAERDALRRRLAGAGIMTTVQPTTITLPSLLFEKSRLRRLVIPLAHQKGLGLTKLSKGTSTLGRLKIEDRPYKRVGYMGLVRDALVYARHTATLQVNGITVDLRASCATRGWRRSSYATCSTSSEARRPRPHPSVLVRRDHCDDAGLAAPPKRG